MAQEASTEEGRVAVSGARAAQGPRAAERPGAPADQPRVAPVGGDRRQLAKADGESEPFRLEVWTR